MYLSDLNDIRWKDDPDAFNRWYQHVNMESILAFFDDMSELDIEIIIAEYGYNLR